jgi:hypothetical protein
MANNGEIEGVKIMKKLFIKTMVAYLIFSGWTYIFGKEIPYFRERVEMPPEISGANTVSEIQPYLESPNDVTRIAAARRLGQLGDQNAVSLLTERFVKEPYLAAMDWSPYVKLEIIVALGKIGGEQAKNSLLNIFNTYWKQGPKSQKYVWEDGDYSSVVSVVLESLYTWRKDNDVYDIFRRTYLEERKIPDWKTQEKAYELYLKAKMEREGVTGQEKEINYLLEKLKGTGHDWIEGKRGVKTLDSLQDGAIVTILLKYGESTLPYIDAELNNVSPIKENRRYEALSYIKGSIEKRLELKRKEKEEKSKGTMIESDSNSQ